ncbi:MAG TPA: ABC transporter permease [Terriglobales bacterium]|nr:ABC transporter permease [Terriglobales bacterium]
MSRLELGSEWRRLGRLIRRGRYRRELREEMELHRDLLGDPRRFGNDLRLRERSQEAWGWRWLEELGQDCRLGLRLLRRTPGLTAVALLSLALGIGANTALFSLTDAMLLRPLPVQHPEQLAQIYLRAPNSPRTSPTFSNPLWEQFRGRQDIFQSAFAWSSTQFNLQQGGEENLAQAVQASGNYFSTLGIAPVAGRLFGPGDDTPGCAAVADISESFWQSRFGGASSAIGSTLTLSGHPFQIIGVTPASFFGVEVGQRFDVAVPLCTEAITAARSLLHEPQGWWLSIMGRLRQEVTPQAAAVRLAVLGPRVMAVAMPATMAPATRARYQSERWEAQPAALGMSRQRRQYGRALWVLLAIAGVVLLVACANLAGLLLARANARRAEIGVRLSLGASRGRLIRQLLTESVILSVGGAALGVGLAAWACAAVQRLLHLDLRLTPDARVLAYTAALAIGTGLLAGILPALRATDVGLAGAARTGAPRPRRHAGGSRGIVAAQIALSLWLLAGAGLFLRTFSNLMAVNTGFDPNRVLLVKMMPDAARPPDEVLRREQTAGLDLVRRLPGVELAAQSFIVPTSGLQWDNSLAVVRGGANSASVPDAYFNVISPGYFATLRTPLLAGRDFSAADRPGAPVTVIVNQTLARALFPHGGALGQWLQQGSGPDQDGPPTQIIGVVADAKYDSLREAAPPTAYYAAAQSWHVFATTSYELRSPLPEPELEREVRAAFAASAPRASFQLQTMDAQIAGTLRPERLLAWISGLFGGLALLLTAIGLYGISSYRAERRRQEFGVRLALGATSGSILQLMLREAGWLLAWGAGAGLLGIWLGTHWLQSQIGTLLFGLSAGDTVTILAAVAALAAVTLLAAARPAGRAAHANPMDSLRQE